MKTIAFFNNKGGVGKTSLVYHLAYMYAELDVTVVAVDLDPQANLTTMFLSDERLEEVWPDDGAHTQTVYGAAQPLLTGVGDVAAPRLESITDRIHLVSGDLALSLFEEELTVQWSKCLDGNPRAFRVISAFWRIMEMASAQCNADLVLIDVGPNLGAINRAALLSSEYVIIPLAPDLYSLRGLKNLGPTLKRWRAEWADRFERFNRNPVENLSIPTGEMRPVGYVVMQHAVRLDRPVKAYDRWMERIPDTYRATVLDSPLDTPTPVVADDPHCLTTLKHYRSLMPLAQHARKPMFLLKAADGALGGHARAVQDCYTDFQSLAKTIASRCGLAE